MTALDKALPQFLGAMLDCLPPKEREGGWRSSASGRGSPSLPSRRGRSGPTRLAEPPLHRGGPPPGGGDGGAGLGTHHFRPTARGLCHLPRRGTPGDLRGGAVRDGTLLSFRRITSLALRVPHTMEGLPAPFCPGSTRGAGAQHPHSLPRRGWERPPSLRDLIRRLSLGEGRRPAGWGVADERGELGGGGAPLRPGPPGPTCWKTAPRTRPC